MFGGIRDVIESAVLVPYVGIGQLLVGNVELRATAFIASPSQRARKTMEPAPLPGGDPANYAIDARLMEMNFGDHIGRSKRDTLGKREKS